MYAPKVLCEGVVHDWVCKSGPNKHARWRKELPSVVNICHACLVRTQSKFPNVQLTLEYNLAIKQHHPLDILWGFYFRSNFSKVYKVNKQAHDHAIITAQSQLIFCTRLYKSAKPFHIAWNRRLLSERCWYNNKLWLVDQTKATLISLHEKQVNITWPWVFATLNKTYLYSSLLQHLK